MTRDGASKSLTNRIIFEKTKINVHSVFCGFFINSCLTHICLRISYLVGIKTKIMANFKTKKSNSQLCYSDFGKGKPVLLIHGWPLSGKSWECQVSSLVEAGFRVITYDRRGFGKSGITYDGYDYSSLAEDLHELINHLDLKKVTLVGFSMGGGEVIRYLTNYGEANIDKIALISSIIPLVAQKDDNPNGVPKKVLDGILKAVETDRLHFLKGFHKAFYNVTSKEQAVSQEQLDFDWSIASHASPIATLKCAESWATTDFRKELATVSVKTLIVHGNKDQTVPIETSGDQATSMIKNNVYRIIENGPHGLNVTHADELNKILIDFLNSN